MRSAFQKAVFALGCSVATSALVACNAAPPEPVESGGSRSTAHSLTVVGASVYRCQSKFQLGANVKSYTDKGWQKTDGSDGIFSVNLENGAVRAIPHPGAPAPQAAPYGSSLHEHSQHVLGYFINCGIPRAEIAGVRGGTSLAGAATIGVVPKLHLRWYASNLDRAIDGIPVIDSVAAARFNANDELVRETVYWPPIPQAALVDAKALRTTLSDPSTLSAFQAALPTTKKSGRVVIRHRGMDNHNGAFGAAAVFDVVDGQTVHHFDVSAHEVKLPWE